VVVTVSLGEGEKSVLRKYGFPVVRRRISKAAGTLMIIFQYEVKKE
jgi:hypothetical protein